MKKITYLNKNTGASISFGNSYPFVLKSIDANSISTTKITSTAIGMDGQHTDSVVYNPRTIICELSFNGISGEKYDRQQMQLNWQRIADIFAPNTEGVLTYDNDAGSYQIDCRPLELPNYSKVIGTYCNFKMQFVADYPFWRSVKTFTQPVQHIEGGLRYPLKYPISYGTISRLAYIDNKTSSILPIKIFGKLTKGARFNLQNLTTGKIIKISNVFANNMTSDIDFELDTYTGRVKGGNIFTFDSDFDIALKQGQNIFELSLFLPAEGEPPEVYIKYNLLYIGV